MYTTISPLNMKYAYNIGVNIYLPYYCQIVNSTHAANT